MNFILQWIDVIWLPLSYFVVHKHQRWWALGYLLACMLMLRLQVELMASTGFSNGILPLMDSHVFNRGIISFGVFNTLYLILAYYSADTRGVIFMAASITIFFIASVTTMLLMVL